MARRLEESRTLSGRAAEDLAAAYLAAQGLALLARNVRCKAGELDLVFRDGAILVVVEVRQRARRDFGGALASVTAGKRRRIIRATRYLLLTHPGWSGSRLRFDVVGVDGTPERPLELHWIKDAFR